jgi:hypothetical protein
MLPLVSGGFIGALVGQRLAPHLPDRQLRRGFAALLIGSALLSGAEAWRRQKPTASHTPQRQPPSSLQPPTRAPLNPIPPSASPAPQSLAPQSPHPRLLT